MLAQALAPLLSPLRAVWAERTAREQALLAGLAAVLLVLAAWFLALGPAMSVRAEARAGFADAVEDHRRFAADLARYRALAADAETRAEAGRPLRTLAGEYARNHELAISRVLPDEDGRLNVWVENVSEAALFSWLADLASEEGVTAARVTIDREGDGVVRAQVLLERGGAA